MKMICRTAKLYLHYVSINVRCMMEYKTSFLLTAIGPVSYTHLRAHET